MAVPSSGELRLYADIGVELGVDQSNVSLGLMSDSAGFAAPDAMSEFYGYVDALAPAAATNAASNVVETTMRLNGNITSDGGAAITERGFYFGTNSASPTNNTKYTVSGATGSYILDRSGLNANTNYYIWAFATNSVGTTYGSRVTQRTLAAFVPTYAAVKTSNSNSGTRAYFTGVSEAYRFRSYLYYLNPNTGSFINRHYFTTTKPNSMSTVYFTVDENFSNAIAIGPELGIMATNTTNRWGVYTDQFVNVDNHSFNGFQHSVTRSSSSYSFTNFTNTASSGFIPQQAVTSATITSYAFVADSSYYKSPLWLVMDFNYS